MPFADRSSGFGSTVASVAVASMLAGPVLVIFFLAIDQLRWGSRSMLSSVGADWGYTLFVFAAVMSLIGSVPAACVNVYVLRLAAQNDLDAPWVSALSGIVIGALVAAVLGGGALLVLAPLTGACMGLLQWFIAIRPFRRSRLSAMNGGNRSPSVPNKRW
jgi:hypothetical protein